MNVVCDGKCSNPKVIGCAKCRNKVCMTHAAVNRGNLECLACVAKFAPKCDDCGEPSLWDCAVCKRSACRRHERSCGPTCRIHTDPLILINAELDTLKRYSIEKNPTGGWFVDWDTFFPTPWKATINPVVGEHELRAEYSGITCNLAIQSVVVNTGNSYPVIVNGEFCWIDTEREASVIHRATVPFKPKVDEQGYVSFVSCPFGLAGHTIVMRAK